MVDLAEYSILLNFGLRHKITSTSTDIVRGYRDIEDRLTEDLDKNPRGVLKYALKTFTSSDYRKGLSALVESQAGRLIRLTDLQDEMQRTYPDFEGRIGEYKRDIEKLEDKCDKLISERAAVGNKLNEYIQDYKLMKGSPIDEFDPGYREKVLEKISKVRKEARRAIFRFNELNHLIFSNVQEKEFRHKSGPMQEINYSVLKQIYETLGVTVTEGNNIVAIMRHGASFGYQIDYDEFISVLHNAIETASKLSSMESISKMFNVKDYRQQESNPFWQIPPPRLPRGIQNVNEPEWVDGYIAKRKRYNPN